MDCPKCNGRTTLRVVVTEHRADGTHRWRRCISCQFAQRTLECLFSPKPKPKPKPRPGPEPGRELPSTQGERNGCAVLTEQNIRDIRRLSEDGSSRRAIAAVYGVHPAHVSRIVNRKIWAHVL
jgi:hypothetical protein